MAVPKKARPLDAAAIRSGLAHIEKVRGITNWGANYVFNSGGLQQDILQIGEAFRTFSTDGAYATDAEVAVISGYIASGNITSVAGSSARAMPSGGFYVNSADGSATGLYHVFFSNVKPTAGTASGYLYIVPV